MRYFKSVNFSACQNCRVAYDNWKVLRDKILEQNPLLTLPISASEYVRNRVCDKIGDAMHVCEDNKCRKCTFTNYFIHDSNAKANTGVYKTFSEEYNLKFLLDEVVEWHEYQTVTVHLPGKTIEKKRK